MATLDCLNIKEYIRTNLSDKFVLALRSTALLYNLSCWGNDILEINSLVLIISAEGNTTKLLEYGVLEGIAEILSAEKQRYGLSDR